MALFSGLRAIIGSAIRENFKLGFKQALVDFDALNGGM